ncbi:phosphoribosylanthranilate isomerase [Myroides sp. LJL119]
MKKEIKICGVNHNIKELETLNPTYLGFIFYPKSSRCLQDKNYPIVLKTSTVYKVGVFVNQSKDFIIKKVKELDLDYIQLHGKETPEDCHYFVSKKIKVFKAFSIDNHFDFNTTTPYQKYCERFIFDTNTPLYGGSGQSFNWDILKKYKGKTSFLLSGGIGLDNIAQAMRLNHPQLKGYDLNSKLEQSPGIKDYNITKKIIKIITHE